MHTYSPLTLDQFNKLLALLEHEDVSNLEIDGFIGSCGYQGLVDFSWKYVADGFSLDVTIVAKHGRAHFASDDTIYDKLNKEFIIPVRE